MGSCRKQQSGEAGTNATSLVGSWELRQAQRGMTPTVAYGAGNGNILMFSDSAYAIYTNGNLTKSGHYRLLKDTSAEVEVGLDIPAGQFTRRIVFDNDFSARKAFIDISGNKLRILSGYFPLDSGSDEMYERISITANIRLDEQG